MSDSRTEHNGIDSVPSAGGGVIAVLNRDVFFGVKIGNTLRGLGYAVSFAKSTSELVRLLGDEVRRPILAIVDINAKPEWDEIAPFIGSSGAAPVLAFGSHLDVDGLRAAKAAGVRRVVSNGDFHRDMVALVRRYAVGNAISEVADSGI